MKTTQLFVELVVIGFGGLVWLALFYLLFVGSFPSVLLGYGSGSWTALLPVLSLVYVLGIVIDRGADRIFDLWDTRHLHEHFANADEYHDARRTLVVHGPQLWEHLTYERSRLRICRGWSLNAAMILVATNLCVTARTGWLLLWQILFIDAVLVALSMACFLTWRSLNQTHYTKIQRQAPWVARMKHME